MLRAKVGFGGDALGLRARQSLAHFVMASFVEVGSRVAALDLGRHLHGEVGVALLDRQFEPGVRNPRVTRWKAAAGQQRQVFLHQLRGAHEVAAYLDVGLELDRMGQRDAIAQELERRPRRTERAHGHIVVVPVVREPTAADLGESFEPTIPRRESSLLHRVDQSVGFLCVTRAPVEEVLGEQEAGVKEGDPGSFDAGARLVERGPLGVRVFAAAGVVQDQRGARRENRISTAARRRAGFDRKRQFAGPILGDRGRARTGEQVVGAHRRAGIRGRRRGRASHEVRGCRQAFEARHAQGRQCSGCVHCPRRCVVGRAGYQALRRRERGAHIEVQLGLHQLEAEEKPVRRAGRRRKQPRRDLADALLPGGDPAG